MEPGQIGRYEVVRSLGQGGMGQVYLARDPKLERQVAIKLLHRDDGPAARALFEREAKALAALNHPNIVTIFEIAEIDDGRQFLAMEYLPGRALRDLLLHDRPPREDLVAICGQVALALAAAHEAGILHRDIKPENVVVGRALAVKVVDFGIARRLDAPPSVDPDRPRAAKTRAVEVVDMFTRTLPVDDAATIETEVALTSMTRTVFGTPAYMAPEVLMGEASSVASDVYSLGVMVYECLAGRRPYEAPALHEIIARVVDGSEPPAQLDDPLGPLVARMLAREPAERPALTEVGKALARRRSVAIAPPPRARARWLVPALGVAATLGLAGVLLWPRDAPEPQPAPQVRPAPRRPVKIRTLDAVTLPSYGVAPDPEAFSITLATLIGSTDVKAFGPGDPGEPELSVGGTIVETAGVVTAHLDVLDVATQQHTTRTVTGKPDQIARLLRKVAAEIIALAAPGSELELRDPTLAHQLIELGKRALGEGKLTTRTFFEQAVAADDSSAEAWDRYAGALALGAAKHETTLLAAERAFQLAPEGPRKQLLHATLLIHRGEYPRALEVVAPLEPKLATLSRSDQRDLLVQLGEGHWHEGRHDQGFGYFKRALELDPHMTEAASHAGEYALARRKEALALQYLAQQHMDPAFVDFAMGRYAKLVDHPHRDFSSWSRSVLGLPQQPPREPLPPEVELFDRIAERAAAGDRAEVERGVATVLAQLDPFTDYQANLLVRLGEVVIAAELAPQARAVLEALRARRPTYSFKRLSILAAPMLGAPQFPRAQLTERLATLQDALEAELAGDRATAAKLLGALVANPTFDWEFVERLALRRNLLALRRTREAAALCADTLKPVTMRQVFHVVRARCLAK